MTKTLLMGILNATPDSFYEGSQAYALEDAITRGLQLHQQGADLLDIGGESTRPGADPVPLEEELRRVIPVIATLSKRLPIPISIDTRKPRVAQAALEAGATFLNDISGLEDPAMRELAASANVDVCVMHMQGTPQTMQNNPTYEEGIVPHLLSWFERKNRSTTENWELKKNISSSTLA